MPFGETLGTGLWVQWKVDRKHRAHDESMHLSEAPETAS